ncbi:energy transducer TonB [Pseudoxanthomonas suwonensis]|uniref:energy transducer TonB n=2 Tax=Pseudoxanthomonas suwonensis TaxID=314722 RepID=UPI00046754A7|nr:hypothetical protein [Pseudoxanthomonas suwonensis]
MAADGGGRMPVRAGGAALAGCVLVLALGACTSRLAGVDQRMMVPEGVARYEMASNQAFVFPAPRENPAPAFPPELAQRELPPTTLCAGFVVDPEGHVRQAKLLQDPGCAPPEAQPQLGAAVVEAVSSWRFDPAVLCVYPDATTRDRDWNGVGCAGAVAEARPVAVTLGWAFTFEVREGRAQVVATRNRAR